MSDVDKYIEILRSIASRHNEVADSVIISICADKLEEEICRLQGALQSIADAYPQNTAKDLRNLAYQALSKHLRGID
jgi:hypothetical protein